MQPATMTIRRRHTDGNTENHTQPMASAPPQASAHRPAARAGPAPSSYTQGVVTTTSRPQATPEWLDKFNEICLSLMDALPYGIVQYCVPRVAPEKKSLVDDLQVGRVVSFSETDPAHMDLLRRLWEGHHRVVFAEPELQRFDASQHRSHEAWKAMGFQGTDPTTDFRGAGCFALEQLVYLVEKHPDLWSRFLTPDFLLGAAGVNVTMRLMSLLAWSKGANVIDMQHRSIVFSRSRAQCRLVDYILGTDGAIAGYRAVDDTPQARMVRLHEVYCTYMSLVHDRWMHSTQNLMEFNSLLNDADAEIVRRLCLCDTAAAFHANTTS